MAKKKLSLSKFQKKEYLQLFLIFGNANKLNKYLDTYFKYHCFCRSQDIYLSYREELFHSNWIGISNNLLEHLDKIYNESVFNLKQNSDIDGTEPNWEEWNQIAKYQCDIFLYELNEMYRKNRALDEFGFEFDELIHILLSNFDEGSQIHLTILNRHMIHPLYGKVIKSRISQINLELWKVRCLDQFDDVILEFIYALKTQFIYALNNENKVQSVQNVECIRTYLFVLKYDHQVAYKLVAFIHFICQFSNDLWEQEFMIKSRRWIPAISSIYYYKNNIDGAFSELFLNGNEDFYFRYPAQLLNYKVHPIRLIKIRCYLRMFQIFLDYRNQITLLRVINTYIYFGLYCLIFFMKKIIRLPWGKISIYLIVIYLCFKAFNAKAIHSYSSHLQLLL